MNKHDLKAGGTVFQNPGHYSERVTFIESLPTWNLGSARTCEGLASTFFVTCHCK